MKPGTVSLLYLLGLLISFLSKYIRAYILKDDPAFDGGFRDQLNRAEKLRLIDNVDIWMEIRELRNSPVHEYIDQDLEKIFEKFRRCTPLLLELPKKVNPMRLSSKEQRTIIQSFKEILPTLKFKLCLFGSRTSDFRKGGDIDLLAIVDPLLKQDRQILKPPLMV